jgi:hypothetical protein
LRADIDEVVANYDAQAYRYPLQSFTADYINTEDKINPYNHPDTRPASMADQQKYQQGSGLLGGTGANISFEFVTKTLNIDTKAGPLTATGLGPMTQAAEAVGTHTLNGETPYLGERWDSYKNPYIDMYFKGYMRGEVYRFGIVFFDKNMIPYPAKWIADIRMPDHYELPHFEIGDEFDDPDQVMKAKPLGIKFTINLPDQVRQAISGFSIVRAPIEEADRTILAQGLMSDIGYADVGGFTSNAPFGRIQSFADLYYPNFKILDSPEFKFNTPQDLVGNFIVPICGLNGIPNLYIDTTTGVTISDPGVTDKGFLIKYNKQVRYFQDNNDFDNLWFFRNQILESESFAPTAGESVTLNNPAGISTGDLISNLEIQRFYPSLTEPSLGVAFPYRLNQTTILRLNNNQNAVYLNDERVVTDDVMNVIGQAGNITGFTLSQQIASRIFAKLLCNVVRPLSNQYGGNTVGAVSATRYVQTGHFQLVKDSTPSVIEAEVFGGDTTIHNFAEIKDISGAFEDVNASLNDICTVQIFPVETRYNDDLRRQRNFGASAVAMNMAYGAEFNPVNGLVTEQFRTPTVLLRSTWTRKFSSDPAEYESLTRFDNRIVASGEKINGELNDSWSQFGTEDYYDVDGNYGPINKILVHNDNMFFWQDRATGAMLINPSAIAQTSVGETILGTGNLLYDHKYLSTQSGSKHRQAVKATFGAVYWYDAITKEFMVLSGSGATPIADLRGMGVFFQTVPEELRDLDSSEAFQGITIAYDARRRDVYFTYLLQSNQETLVFDESEGVFVSKDSTSAPHYLEHREYMLSPTYTDGVLRLWSHYEGPLLNFYGQDAETFVTLLINPAPLQTKIFDTVEMESRGKQGARFITPSFNDLSSWNSYQHSGIIPLSINQNIKNIENKWQFAIPRNVVTELIDQPDIFDPNNWNTSRLFKERMRDKFQFIKLSVLPDGLADRFYINYIAVNYRESHR